jgi:lysozyme
MEGEDMIGSKRSRLVAGVLALAVCFTGTAEGLRLSPYYDSGHVLTDCYGRTVGVVAGRAVTKSTCDAALTSDLQSHEAGMVACLSNPDAIPDRPYLSFLDFTYNVGARAACGSTMFRMINAGNIRGACGEFGKWIYVKGQAIPGLVNRRKAEAALCLSGI